MRQDVAYLAFNRGLVSRLGLARADIKRLAMSASISVNWMSRVLGSMMLRPGLGYLGGIRSDAKPRMLPFVFSIEDKAKIELTNLKMRVWVNDSPIARRAVTTTITNPTFTTNLTGWTDDDDPGATSTWVAPGYMQLLGDGTAAAIRYQQVTVAGANIGVQHALNIVITRGPVTFKVGSTSGGVEYISETDLDEGYHSLAFTPTGDFYIQFESRLKRIVWVDQCDIETSGFMAVTTPWVEADLGKIRFDQSADILFVACEGYQQYKIERRTAASWSVVKYQTEDGPFRNQNTGPNTMTSNVLSGNGTLTSFFDYFKNTHVGALFELVSTGQAVNASISAQNVFSNSIEVTGVGTDRAFTILISGIWTGTVTLQRSFDGLIWTDVPGQTWTANTTASYTDALDNQTVNYRIGIKTGDYGSGTAVVDLSIAIGSITGTVRVTGFIDTKNVSIEVLIELGGTIETEDWSESKWSDYRGWPTAVRFNEGRLGWFGKDSAILSVSDNFYSFDSNVEGDSAPINRTIGSGPVEVINWALSLGRLILGGQGAEHSCRSSSLDEPLTVTNFNIKKASTQGSAEVDAVNVDANGIYVQRGGSRVFQLTLSSETLDYASEHLSALVPTIGKPGIVRIGVQRQPDTRVHFVRTDGTVAVLVFDKIENVICWLEIESDGATGLIEDVVILPGDPGEDEDHVYYVTNRTINGTTKRSLERWAFEEDCLGADINLLADSYVVYNGAPATVIPVAHLEGQQVVVWADGVDVGHDENDDLIYTVTGGVITLTTAASIVVVGLPYFAPWQSGKLVQLQSQLGSAMKHRKNIEGLGLIMADVHPKGLKIGQDFNVMDDLPSVEGGYPIDPDEIRTDYDEDSFVFPGDWTVDSRLCLKAMAPRPVTVLAAICDVEHNR